MAISMIFFLRLLQTASLVKRSTRLITTPKLSLGNDPALSYIASSAGIGTDPYKLGDLHVMLNRVNALLCTTPSPNSQPPYAIPLPSAFDNYSWVIAFNASASIAQPVKYGIYIDIDHLEGSGASVDPLNKPISVDSLYLPEYVIYIDRVPCGDPVTTVDPTTITLFTWNGNSWTSTSLSAAGGNAWFASDFQVVQLLVPYTALGGENKNFSGSLAMTVFSTNSTVPDGIHDVIPTQTASNTIDKPAFVSDMLMPLYPFDTPLSNPMVHDDVPPMRWRMPIFDSDDGYQVQVARDAKFTDLVETWEFSEQTTNSLFGWLPNTFQPLAAYEDNESYYWRVRIRHERFTFRSSDFDYGQWSPATRFKLDSRRVAHPTLSTGTLAGTTPTFSWDRVDGASGYTLQVDNDANFSSPVINEKLVSNSYTPLTALPDGNYFWRVAMRRSETIIGHWLSTVSITSTTSLTFEKKSLAPTLLSPINPAAVITE